MPRPCARHSSPCSRACRLQKRRRGWCNTCKRGATGVRQRAGRSCGRWLVPRSSASPIDERSQKNSHKKHKKSQREEARQAESRFLLFLTSFLCLFVFFVAILLLAF